jgi:ubiquinone/menaquinone biosynthesis C-methylase UbiE
VLKESLPVLDGRQDANSPGGWEATFASIPPLTPRREQGFQREARWGPVMRHVPRGTRVLDAGCGIGDWTMALRRQGRDVVGMDYSARIVEALRTTYPEGEWCQGDVRHRLPFPDASFGAVVSWGVIEHDEAGPGAALLEFHRILKPGGRLIVTVPVHDRWNERASRYCRSWLARRGGRNPAFFQYYMTEADLTTCLEGAGLRVLDSERLGPPLLGKALPALYHATKWHPVLSAVLHRGFARAFAWTDRFHHMLSGVAERPVDGIR